MRSSRQLFANVDIVQPFYPCYHMNFEVNSQKIFMTFITK